METVTYTAARANLAKTMQQVCDNHEPVIITRQREAPVVMLSLEDYQSMEETAYLLRSPKNVRRILESVAELAPSLPPFSSIGDTPSVEPPPSNPPFAPASQERKPPLTILDGVSSKFSMGQVTVQRVTASKSPRPK